MKLIRQSLDVLFLLFSSVFCSSPPTFGQYTQLAGADGNTIFSHAFDEERRAAEKTAQKTQTVEPMLKLLEKYKKPEEVAELELTLGLMFNQRTGLVNPTQAVIHLTNALKYKLPEETWLKALGWRAGSFSGLGKYDEEMKDCLRSLLTMSYHDFSGGSPEIKGPTVSIYMGQGSDNPENLQRQQDYMRYRRQTDLQRFLFMNRYFQVSGGKKLQERLGLTDEQVRRLLNELSPDTSRHEIVMQWLKTEFKPPWGERSSRKRSSDVKERAP